MVLSCCVLHGALYSNADYVPPNVNVWNTFCSVKSVMHACDLLWDTLLNIACVMEYKMHKLYSVAMPLSNFLICPYL